VLAYVKKQSNIIYRSSLCIYLVNYCCIYFFYSFFIYEHNIVYNCSRTCISQLQLYWSYTYYACVLWYLVVTINPLPKREKNSLSVFTSLSLTLPLFLSLSHPLILPPQSLMVYYTASYSIVFTTIGTYRILYSKILCRCTYIDPSSIISCTLANYYITRVSHHILNALK